MGREKLTAVEGAREGKRRQSVRGAFRSSLRHSWEANKLGRFCWVGTE